MEPTISVRNPVDEAATSAQVLGRQQFAGSALALVGVMHVLQGVVGLSSPGALHDADYAYAWNATAWGWALLVLGIAASVVGVGVLVGRPGSRPVGVLVAMLSAVVSFVLVPQAPAWALVVLGLDVAVVWTLTVLGQTGPSVDDGGRDR